MITVYHAPLTRSCRVLWLLEEIGQPHRIETVAFTPEFLRSREFRALNPMARLPVIRDDEGPGGEPLVLWESGAILQYLLERFGKGRLMPPPGSREHALALQWFFFAEGTAMPPLGDIAQHAVLRPEEARIPAVVPDAIERCDQWMSALDEGLEGRTFVVGDAFGAADIMLGYTLALARALGRLGEAHPRVRAYLEGLSQRPAFQKAFAGAPPG